MTVYCSSLANDQDMIKALGSVALPLPANDLGDCYFSGLGPDDSSVLVSIERKKIGDLAQCIINGRYLDQAQRAVAAGADVLVLVVEAEQVRSNPEDGVLEQLNWGINPRTMKRCQVWEPVRPTIMYSRYDQYLTELARDLGVIVKRTADVQETASVIRALWDNFQSPPDEHQSLHSIHKAPLRDVLLVKPSLLRRIASELPGVGWEWSKSAEARFRSVREMANADVADWTGIQHESDNGRVRRLGKKTADKVVSAIVGGGIK